MVPLVQELAHFRVALQHGADNLIVVMDDDEEDMGEAELEERYGPHWLVPIEELNGLDLEDSEYSEEEDEGPVAGPAGLDTGDKGPNTHWAHCEHIESIGNM